MHDDLMIVFLNGHDGLLPMVSREVLDNTVDQTVLFRVAIPMLCTRHNRLDCVGDCRIFIRSEEPSVSGFSLVNSTLSYSKLHKWQGEDIMQHIVLKG